MKKKRPILLCSLTIVLMCLLTISSTFQTICVKTLGNNYLDALTINQIVDLVIDQDENIQFKQLQQLQIDLKMNKELYNFNCYAFDYTIRHINDEKIQLDQKKINQSWLLKLNRTYMHYVRKYSHHICIPIWRYCQRRQVFGITCKIHSLSIPMNNSFLTQRKN